MNIKPGDIVLLKDWEEISNDGVLWLGLEEKTYNELKQKLRKIEGVIEGTYIIMDDYGNRFYFTDEAIKKVCGAVLAPMGYGIQMEAYTQMIRGMSNPQKEETSNSFKEFIKDIFRNGYIAGTVNGLNWETAFESFYKIMINNISEKE